jgi:hypothetical protein
MASRYYTRGLSAIPVPNPETFERTPRVMREGTRGKRWCVYAPGLGSMHPFTGPRDAADGLSDWATCVEAVRDPETGFTDIAYVGEDGKLLLFREHIHEWQRFPEPDPERTEIRVDRYVVVVEPVEDGDPASYVSQSGVSRDVASARTCVRVTAQRTSHYGRVRYKPVQDGPVLVSAGGGWFELGGDLDFDGLDVNPTMCDAVFEGSGTLAVVFHPSEVDRLASAGIAAIGVSGPYGWCTSPLKGDDYLRRDFFRRTSKGGAS